MLNITIYEWDSVISVCEQPQAKMELEGFFFFFLIESFFGHVQRSCFDISSSINTYFETRLVGVGPVGFLI